jgi:predicted adenine nucleotide alpha hydrolase (AANH) superfamily ATPase
MPEKSKRVLLHCCCAPDSTVPIRRLAAEGWLVYCGFYGSNIQPEEEYRWREKEMERVSRIEGVALRVLSYEPETWLSATRLLAAQPEGGYRCGLCFALQLQAMARCARVEGIETLCTTLTISPHKDPGRINRIGRAVAQAHGLCWLERIWRKGGGFLESVRESREMGIKRQVYCGCRYSFKGDEKE